MTTINSKTDPAGDEYHPVPRGIAPSKVEVRKWRIVDEPGVFLEIYKNDLVVDRDYQRQAISEKNVLRIASEWSWLACGVIIVADRDGQFFVIDGQHRVLAARKRIDVRALPCLVFETSGGKSEASAFVRINTARSKVSASDQVRASCVAGDEVMARMMRMILESGFTDRSKGGPNTVSCIASVRSQFILREGVVTKLWPLLAGLHKGASIGARNFGGLVWLEVNATESLTSPRWTARLYRIGHERLEAAAHKDSIVAGKGGARVWAAAMLREINSGLHSKLKLKANEVSYESV